MLTGRRRVEHEARVRGAEPVICRSMLRADCACRDGHARDERASRKPHPRPPPSAPACGVRTGCASRVRIISAETSRARSDVLCGGCARVFKLQFWHSPHLSSSPFPHIYTDYAQLHRVYARARPRIHSDSRILIRDSIHPGLDSGVRPVVLPVAVRPALGFRGSTCRYLCSLEVGASRAGCEAFVLRLRSMRIVHDTRIR